MNVVEAVWEMVSQALQLGITDYEAYCTRLLGSRPPPTGAPQTTAATIAPGSASALSHTSSFYSWTISESSTTNGSGRGNFSISGGSSSRSNGSSSGNISMLLTASLIPSRFPDGSNAESYTLASDPSNLSLSVSPGTRSEFTSGGGSYDSRSSNSSVSGRQGLQSPARSGGERSESGNVRGKMITTLIIIRTCKFKMIVFPLIIVRSTAWSDLF